MSKDNFLSSYSLEADLYDTSNWYKHDEYSDLVPTKVASTKLHLSSTTTLGFPGYLLHGKLGNPRLWSAEQVRNLTSFVIIFKHHG